MSEYNGNGGRFAAGNPGRPKGSRSKEKSSFGQTIGEFWEKYGEEFLEATLNPENWHMFVREERDEEGNPVPCTSFEAAKLAFQVYKEFLPYHVGAKPKLVEGQRETRTTEAILTDVLNKRRAEAGATQPKELTN